MFACTTLRTLATALSAPIVQETTGNKRYLVGRLDDGEIFVEKIPKDNLHRVYKAEQRL
jgi:hypothetical protein